MGQQHGAGDRSTSAVICRYLGRSLMGWDDLALVALAAQLDTRFVDEPEPADPARCRDGPGRRRRGHPARAMASPQ